MSPPRSTSAKPRSAATSSGCRASRATAGWRSGATGRASTRRPGPGLEQTRQAAEGYLTRQGAQRELDAILADARVSGSSSRRGGRSTVTFEEAAREWLRYVEFDRKRRPATIKDYRWIVEKRLLPEFGEAKLEEVTTPQIDAWRVSLVAAGDAERRGALGEDDQQVPRA